VAPNRVRDTRPADSGDKPGFERRLPVVIEALPLLALAAADRSRRSHGDGFALARVGRTGDATQPRDSTSFFTPG
jgi:hypothetical protein